MTLRFYTTSDYVKLRTVYEQSGWFDPETDAEEKLKKQIEKDPESILLTIDNDTIVGTVTLLFTGRLGLFFRLHGDTKEIRGSLLKKGEQIFKNHGYNEVHILTPEEDLQRQEDYADYGFKKSRPYRWFWKKIN